MLETLDHTIRIGITPTFLYDLQPGGTKNHKITVSCREELFSIGQGGISHSIWCQRNSTNVVDNVDHYWSTFYHADRSQAL